MDVSVPEGSAIGGRDGWLMSPAPVLDTNEGGNFLGLAIAVFGDCAVLMSREMAALVILLSESDGSRQRFCEVALLIEVERLLRPVGMAQRLSASASTDATAAAPIRCFQEG